MLENPFRFGNAFLSFTTIRIGVVILVVKMGLINLLLALCQPTMKLDIIPLITIRLLVFERRDDRQWSTGHRRGNRT